MDNTTSMALTTPDFRAEYAPIARDIAVIYAFLFCLLGSLFNGVSSLVIINRRLHSTTTTGVFLVWLAAADTTVLYTAVLDAINSELLPLDQRSVWLCRISSFIQSSAQLTSSWILVAVIIDRYISVKYQHRVPAYATTRVAQITCAVMTTVAIGYSLHLWWMVYEHHGSCRPNHIGYPAWTALSWVSITLYCFIPGVILIVVSSMIIHLLRKEKNNSARDNASSHQSLSGEASPSKDLATHSSSHRQVSVLLLVISFGFVVCTIPSASCLAMEMSLGSEVCPASSVEDLIINEAVSYGLAYLNHSCKLVVYMCTWCFFRREFLAMLKKTIFCGCCRESRNVNSRDVNDVASVSSTVI